MINSKKNLKALLNIQNHFILKAFLRNLIIFKRKLDHFLMIELQTYLSDIYEQIYQIRNNEKTFPNSKRIHNRSDMILLHLKRFN